ncbi:MAG: right-handed parallel beta-helix repeat-containing protein [Mariniblastus sp.]|nr:right-handed parallel beta-helix repeat-containing protein [Mariniblastus sp.]
MTQPASERPVKMLICSSIFFFIVIGADPTIAEILKAGPTDDLQSIVDRLTPGDTLILESGLYDQAFVIRAKGTAQQPIQIRGEGKVRFTGLTELDVAWKKIRPGIFQAQVPKPVRQLFADDQMMIPARWPNMTFEERWDNSKWPQADPGSEYGSLIDAELADSGHDFTGCVAILNIGSWQTFRRVIQKHDTEKNRLIYPTDPNSRLHQSKHPTEIDRYCLYGEAALDAPGEWFFDEKQSLLKVCLPEGTKPSQLRWASKVTDTAILGERCRYVKISGIEFFGTTIRMHQVQHCQLSDLEIAYGSTLSNPFGPNQPLSDQKPITWSARRWFGESSVDTLTEIIGDDNLVQNMVARYSEGPILTVIGQRNRIENCLFQDFDWHGLDYGFGIDLLAAAPVTVRHVTLDHCGGSEGLRLPNHGKSLVEYCHLHHCGLRQSDGSIIQTSGAGAAGTEIRFNWIHDHHAFHWGGNGIRGDDGSRGLLIHHNVIWNCPEKAIVTKGDQHEVFHNTCFDNARIDILLPRNRLPGKTKELVEQNRQSRAFNNWSRLTGSWSWEKPKVGPYGILKNNQPAERSDFRDIPVFDFRPRTGSAAIDAGISPQASNPYPVHGRAPDLGAYETGQPPWQAGYQTNQ